MRLPTRRSAAALLAVSTLALAGCGASADRSGDGIGGGTGGTPRPAATPYRTATTLADWPTYHHTSDRSGVVSTGPSGRLQVSWTRALRGAVYGEPLVIGSTLVVATERNEVYGLDARTGAVRWQVGLGTAQPQSGLPCGNVDPLGVTGTPAYDPVTRRVFVAAETVGGAHTLWAIDPTNGARAWHRSLDTQPRRNRKAEQERGALLVDRGRVVTVFGGLDGDCSDYVGYAASVPTNDRGATTSYAVPTAREAGMWATPGAVAGPRGSILVASGNGAEVRGRWDGSDSVIALDPVTMRRLSVFAPGSWASDNAQDLDLGSSSPAVVTARGRVVIAGKRGTVYLLAAPFHGVGSALTRINGCKAFGGTAVVGSVVLMPCLGQDSVRALNVGAHALSWRWTHTHLYGSPVVAAGRVYVADRGSGDLVVLSLATGRQLSRQRAGPLPHFPSQIVSGDYVFVPTLKGITAFRGQ